MRTTDHQQNALNYSTGDNSWGEMTWQIVEPGKLVRAQAEQPDGKTFRLTFDAGSGVSTCPTKFQAINRAQWEAEDQHRRLLAQQQQPARMKPPKW